MNDFPETLEQLSDRLDELEKRVLALERPHEAPITAPLLIAPTAEEHAIEQASGVFPILGRAVLGIAGAYALRAMEASAAVPGLAMGLLAIGYAMGWVVWAARAERRTYLAGAIYAGTSALILAPTLWELVLRFRVASAGFAALMLLIYVATASALAWKHARSEVYWIAHAAAAATGFILGIASHNLAPFLVTLLGIVLINEYSAVSGHERSVRPLVSLVAAADVWVLIFVYSGPPNASSGYPALNLAEMLAPGCVLFVINAGGITARAVQRRQPVPILDTVQAGVAFALAAASVLYLAPHAGQVFLGIVCLILSAACYTAWLTVFQRESEARNGAIFAIWSAGLLLAGTLWSMPSNWMSLCLGIASIASIAFGARLNSKTLGLHGVVYLGAAAAASGLIWHAARMLAGGLPGRPAWSIYAAAFFALAGYAVAKEPEAEDWRLHIGHFVLAFLAAFAFTALLAQGLLRVMSLWVVLDVFHIAFVRTFSVCILALALAYGGSRLKRMEMTRIAYAALAFVAAKLLFEDLRHGRMEFIAGSLFLFAVTLIGVPRLGHKSGPS